MLFAITAISGTYPDNALKKQKLFCLSLHLNVGLGWVGLDL